MIARLVVKHSRFFHRLGFFLTAFLMIIIGLFHLAPDAQTVTDIWPGTTAWGVIFIVMGISSALAGLLWTKYDSSPIKTRIRALAALVIPIALIARGIILAISVGWAGFTGVLLLGWMAVHILHAQIVLWYLPTKPDEFAELTQDQARLRRRLRVVESEVQEALSELDEE